VDVKVLVPNNLTDASSVRQASHYSYQELLQAGVKIFEYQTTFMHAKSIEVDGVWSIIGSANMDNRSLKINEEGVYGVSDTDFTGRLEVVFKQDLTHARQITLPEWEKRSYFDRAREIFARKFVQQY
jgi:cardiolipin synthase